jgi:hypothetical protein
MLDSDVNSLCDSFKIGDKIVCINSGILCDSIPEIELELYKIYIVCDVIGDFLSLQIDFKKGDYLIKNTHSLWYKHHFISLNEYRKLKINTLFHEI